MASPTTVSKQSGDLEAKFFAAMIKNMKNKPEIDWNGVADELGYANANTAKVRFGQIKKKLGLNFGNTPSSEGSRAVKRPATKALSSKAKRPKKASADKASANEAHDDQDVDSVVPDTLATANAGSMEFETTYGAGDI
ncbi:hypothetical protein TruAng_000403 [Truncatella angustata]|nr:hypothetical protein TruAng_000403 [Truncatella angustata]